MANIVPRRDQPGPLARRFGEWDPFERMREILQWDPFQELPRRWFGEDANTPRFDVREEKDAFVFKADLPGIKEDDVDISITGNRLTVSGKREEETVKESESYYCRERSFGSFARSFTLPDSVDTDQIQANMQDGVLSLRIPKSADAQPKKIPLRAGNGGERAKGKS